MAQCPIRPVSTVGSGAPVGRRARARQPLACWACLPQEGRCRRVQCGAGRCWGGALGKGNVTCNEMELMGGFFLDGSW